MADIWASVIKKRLFVSKNLEPFPVHSHAFKSRLRISNAFCHIAAGLRAISVLSLARSARAGTGLGFDSAR